MPTPNENDVVNRQEQIEKLKMFLSNATEQWDSSKPIRRFSLPTGEYISCVCWNNTFFISGTDIIRALSFRFHAFGRPVTNTKKFEEGVFSDLRNLKSGRDATLEVPKSELLDLLYKFGCIRTQKKQKVFYWFSVPHDRLFLDALDRDLKREKIGIKSTTTAVAQPATLVSSDTIKKIFYELKSNLLLDKRTRSTPDTSRSLTSGNYYHWQFVNSVPSTFDQLQSTEHNFKQDGYLQNLKQASPSCAQDRHLSSFSTPAVLSSSEGMLTGFGEHSNNEIECNDYLDPIANGVNQLDISSNPNPPQHNNIIPLFSSSLNSEETPDSDTLKKTKAMFGNLNLLGGSPSYKQRRNRTNSLSLAPSSSGGPDRFVPDQLPTHSNLPVSSLSWQHESSLNYHCPVDNCRRLFKRVDLLDLHISIAHAFMCSVCGRRFSHAESLIRHGQITHEIPNIIGEESQIHPQHKESFTYYPQLPFEALPLYHDIHRSTSLSSVVNADYNMMESDNSRKYSYLEPDMLTSSVSSLN
ncbi:STE-domain-containing protein [Backusella circina FSU 941]|nr:STE-domain-containing protein [Backusella circina FSU 941]